MSAVWAPWNGLQWSRRHAGAGQMRRRARAPRAVHDVISGSIDDPESIFDTQLVFWGEGDDVTLNGGDVSALNNKYATVGGSLNQATASDQPEYFATGGPNSTPTFEMDVSEHLLDASDWIAADTDFTFYIVFNATALDNGSVAKMGNMPLFQHLLQCNSTFANVSTGVSASTWYAARGRRDDDNELAWRLGNASETTAALPAASYAVNPLQIGDSDFGVTPLTRVAHYTLIEKTVPTASEDSAMAAYLNEKFGLGLTW